MVISLSEVGRGQWCMASEKRGRAHGHSSEPMAPRSMMQISPMVTNRSADRRMSSKVRRLTKSQHKPCKEGKRSASAQWSPLALRPRVTTR